MRQITSIINHNIYMIEVVWAPNLNLRTNKIWKAKISKKHGYLLIFQISVYLQPPRIINIVTRGPI